MGRWAIGVMCALLAVACSKGTDKDSGSQAKGKTGQPPATAAKKASDAGQTAAVAPGPMAATATDASAGAASAGLAAKTVAELPAVTEVPPLDTKLVPWPKQTASKTKNGAGYKLHKANKLAEAAAAYAEAVKLDPFNLLARYNLASIWVQTGKPGKALRLLSQFARPDCEVCRGILVHARGDKEWAKVATHPVFVAITKDAKIDKPRTVLAGTNAVVRSLRKNKVTKALLPYLHPHRAVMADSRPVRGAAELEKWIKKATPDDGSGYYEFFAIEERQKCNKRCCSFKTAPSDTAASLEEVCFKKMPGGPLVLDKLVIYEYMRDMPN